MDVNGVMNVVFGLVSLVLSVVCHEVAHGYVAYRLGDPTAHQARRLTLNPVHHIDLFGSVILPLILVVSGSSLLFGYAKPVPFNPSYFRDPKRGIMLVGLAGPVTNLLLALAAALLLRVFQGIPVVALFLFSLCSINIVLAVFNLIPIPPLDGSRVLVGFLSPDLAASYLRIERYGFLIIFALLYTGLLDRILAPVEVFLLRLLL